jgi:aminotransferase in exopolysaccharide biosynthesis
MDLNIFSKFVREKFKTNEFIPLHVPTFIGNEEKYVGNTIKSTFVSSVGKYVDQFELDLASKIKIKRAVAIVNGTSALQVALRLAGVKKNNEVITQSLTFVATANAIKYNDAHPVFIDVDLDTMGLSPVAVNDFLEEFGEIRDDGCYNKLSGRKISACMPMHTFGFPVHLEELVKVCNKWRIPLVEDAAESLGSEYKNTPLGNFGFVSAISFNGNKIITTGGGGSILTNNDTIADKAKHLTTTAKKPHPYEYFHDELGYNFRMPNLNAALGCAQLENLDYFLESKRGLAKDYNDFFKSNGIKFRNELKNTKANYWLMCIELDNKKERDLFLKETNKLKIMTRPIWNLMHRLPMYSSCQKDSQKNSIFLEKRIINIPSSARK